MPWTQSSQQASLLVYLGIVRLRRVGRGWGGIARACACLRASSGFGGLTRPLWPPPRSALCLSRLEIQKKKNPTTSFRSIGACWEKSCRQLLMCSKGASWFWCCCGGAGTPSVKPSTMNKAGSELAHVMNMSFPTQSNEPVSTPVCVHAWVRVCVCVCVYVFSFNEESH